MKINLTPVIDIVFLLIIFLIVVYQGSSNENIDLLLPADCNFAQTKSDNAPALTISVFKDAKDGAVVFAVDSEKIKRAESDTQDISEQLTEVINANLLKNDTSKTLLLRIDKNITYRDAQYVLSAVAKSQANGLEIAAVKTPAAIESK